MPTEPQCNTTELHSAYIHTLHTHTYVQSLDFACFSSVYFLRFTLFFQRITLTYVRGNTVNNSFQSHLYGLTSHNQYKISCPPNTRFTRLVCFVDGLMVGGTVTAPPPHSVIEPSPFSLVTNVHVLYRSSSLDRHA